MNAGTAQKSHKKPLIRRSLDWQEHAVCVDHDPEMFFDPERYDQALQVCSGCPVLVQCREFGKGLGPGVWGGRVQRGRAREATPVGLVQLRPHGTDAARRRHHRRGEPLCPACREG